MTVAPGQFRLHRQAAPALAAGTYRVRLSANTLPGVAQQDERYVEVSGPRLRLDPGDVAAMSPSDQAAGDFRDQLPYVAVTRRTLPWERTGPAAAGGMWLALLVTRESPAPEAVLGNGPLSDAASLPGIPPSTVVSLLRVNASGVPVVRAQLSGMPARCHVREINLSDTPTMGPDDDGWQAVVVGTRLPLAAAEPGNTYRASLVSLEGRSDLPLPTGATAASFLTLHSWTFTSLLGGASFERLVAERLTIGIFGGEATLPAVDRAGRESTVTYGSPLRGTSGGGGNGTTPEDVSSRSAFELGRLLAAADGRLLRELVAWRRARQWAETGSATDVALNAALRTPEGELAATEAIEALPRSERAAAAIFAHLDADLPEADVFDVRGLQ